MPFLGQVLKYYANMRLNCNHKGGNLTFLFIPLDILNNGSIWLKFVLRKRLVNRSFIPTYMVSQLHPPVQELPDPSGGEKREGVARADKGCLLYLSTPKDISALLSCI